MQKTVFNTFEHIIDTSEVFSSNCDFFILLDKSPRDLATVKISHCVTPTKASEYGGKPHKYILAMNGMD